MTSASNCSRFRLLTINYGEVIKEKLMPFIATVWKKKWYSFPSILGYTCICNRAIPFLMFGI